MRARSSNFSPFWQIAYTAFIAVSLDFNPEDYGFSAVYYSLSVGVKQTDHLMILTYIYYFVGNVSDCGDHSSPNSAFGDGYL